MEVIKMPIFDLSKIQDVADGMPQVFVLLSDTSRLLALGALSCIKEWDWRYNGNPLNDEQRDVADEILDLAQKEILYPMLTATILMFGGSVLPDGWLWCNGAAISRTEYDDLFGVIGTTFGNGDGSTTFNLPSLNDKFPVGEGGSLNIGDTGGEAEHTLSVAEMPTHNHTEGIATPVMINGGLEAPAASSIPSVASTSSTGGGLPHNNLPPYLALAFIIKA
jgi:microcystin-dependent protein